MKPYYDESGITLYCGDSRTALASLPDKSVNCCVTSPPYWGLRDYGVEGQIGLEESPDAYVAEMVAVMREVRRVLKDDGTLWLNLGDSYCASPKGNLNGQDKSGLTSTRTQMASVVGFDKRVKDPTSKQATNRSADIDAPHRGRAFPGIKPKDLVGIPWLVAFALRADGWYLRNDIIWSKTSCMPESVVDRCTKSHEYIFLLSKSEKYHFNLDAIKEPAEWSTDERKDRAQEHHKAMPTAERNGIRPSKKRGDFGGKTAEFEGREAFRAVTLTRQKRTVWTVGPQPFKAAHFATFPPKLIEPCIRAGCPDGGVVLDPFFGAGTTGVVCRQQHVRCIGIELNPAYCAIAVKRLAQGVLFGADGAA